VFSCGNIWVYCGWFSKVPVFGTVVSTGGAHCCHLGPEKYCMLITLKWKMSTLTTVNVH